MKHGVKKGLTITVKAPRMSKRILGADTGFISVFRQEAVEEVNLTLEKLAKAYVKRVKEAIEFQKYDWEPLSERYKAHKRAEDLDPRIYIATGFFLEHITVWRDREGRLHAGLRPNVIHPDAHMPLTTLARIHEFGQGDNPARPLWRTAMSLTLKANKRYADQYRRHVVEKTLSAKS